MDDGTKPISDEELLYRRVSATSEWYSAETGLNPLAFAPHKTEDATGLSVSRADYKSIEEAAKGRPGKSYYIAIVQAGALRQNGIEVVPDPRPGDPGHALLPGLNADNRKADKTLEMQRLLAENLCLRVEGPFAPS